MIPILFEGTETTFATNGLGRIPCTSCIVREERNGVYVCTFTVAISEEIYPKITEGRIIYCIHDDAKDAQPFDIYGRSAPMNGLVTFYAQHVSYRLNKITVKPFTAANCSTAIAGIKDNSINTNPFTFWTNKSVAATFKNEIPTTARALLAGQAGSILDAYGKGEYKWDKWAVNLYVNRGSDKGVTIRYGKNLMDIKQDTDQSSAYNAVAPYWVSAEDGTVVTLTAGMVVKTDVVVNNQIKCVPLDMSDKFDSAPTQSQLSAAATEWLADSNAWVMKDNIVVDFVALWESPEYEQYAGLERVSLCDKVSVIHPALGIAANKIEVISVEYDVLRERYTRMELGEAKQSFADVIKTDAVKTVMSQVPSTDVMEEAIAHATEMITGADGGNIVIKRDANGKPYELLVMDTADTGTAVNVWRWNMGGLGHSHSGYDGPYNDIALTADGRINANMITTGVLRAIQIINGNGTFTVGADGVVNASAIHITGGSINITTQTESYDVIELSYDYNGTLKTSKFAPLGATIESDDGTTATKAAHQAGGTFFYVNNVNRSIYGASRAEFNDDAGTPRGLYQSNSLFYNDDQGKNRTTLQTTFFSFKDAAETTRGLYQSNSIYYYDDQGKNRLNLQTSSLSFKDASEATLASYATSGLTYYDQGKSRVILQHTGLFLQDASEVAQASYTSGGAVFYDSAGIVRSQVYNYGYNLRDDTGQVRLQLESQKISMKSASNVLLREDTPSDTKFYSADGTLLTSLSNLSLTMYSTSNDVTYTRAKMSLAGFSAYDTSGYERTMLQYGGLYVKDTAGTIRATYYDSGIMYKDASNVSRAYYGYDGITVRDTSGNARFVVNLTHGMSIRDSTGQSKAVYGESIELYDSSYYKRVNIGWNDGLQFLPQTGTYESYYKYNSIGLANVNKNWFTVESTAGVTVHHPGASSTDIGRLNWNGLYLSKSLGVIVARVTQDGFDIRNASDYGVTIDGQGHSTALGNWQWKQVVTTDNTTVWIPCFVPN